MSVQASTVARYFSLYADHDVSADTLTLSFDGGATWPAVGEFVAAGSLPAAATSAAAKNPPPSGFAMYWWRVETSPTSNALQVGTNLVLGKLTDSQDEPHFAWPVYVAPGT
jgi:hypothetical protein